MTLLLMIAIIPVLLAVAAMLVPLRTVKALVPVLLWGQLGLLTYWFWPVLSGAQPLLTMSPDFSASQIDALFVLLSTVVVASCLSHAAHYFSAVDHELEPGHVRVFYASACLFLLALTAVFLCDNLGGMWIAVEATTLTSAPLVYFDRTKNAVEATWKYLIICSVGIAFALMGVILLFASSQQGGTAAGTLSMPGLLAQAPHLDFQLARLGFVFCVVGFGTKAGMFPLHNWLPDAHSEAPAPASAMLSGALLNGALFAIWRVSQIITAAHHSGSLVDMVTVMGAVTAVAASLMLIRQHSFKRMWAYSSIENVGIMLVAIGIGSSALFFFQALNHSLAKVALFLVTGNVIQSAGTKRLSNLHGVIVTAPAWGILLALGAFAVTGMPPFGMFVSEIAILVSASNARYWPIVVALLAAVSISFVAVSAHVGRIICGGATPSFRPADQVSSSLMPGFLMACSILLGIMAGPLLWSQMK